MEEGGNNEAAAVIAKPKDEEEQRGGSFKYVPEEIVLNILPNLPAGSLLRFRCVSKQWSFPISRGITEVRKVIVPSNQPFLFESMDQNAQVEDIKIEVVNTETEVEKTHPKVFPWIYGFCNGFLLIRVGINLFLWNPSTRRTHGMLNYRPLAEYPPRKVISGICFDSNSNEYKVVLGLNNRNWRDRSVRVGSFKTKSWSRFDDFPYNVSHFKSGPTLNNYLHWWSADAIIYFDPKVDKFMNISLPEEFVKDDCNNVNPFYYNKYYYIVCSLGVLDGCLCMAGSQELFTGSEVVVYVRKQYGVKVYWDIMFKLSNMEYEKESRNVRFTDLKPLFFMDEQKNRVLIHVTRTEREWFEYDSDCEVGGPKILSVEYVVLAYDIDSDHSTDIDVSDFRKYQFDGAVVYEETLVRPISTTNNGKRAVKVPFGGKTVWRVKNDETKAEKSVVVEEKKVMTGVDEKWEEPRKTRGKKQAAAVSALARNQQQMPMSNAFDLLNEYE